MAPDAPNQPAGTCAAPSLMPEFLAPVAEAAQMLIGATLLVDGVGGLIVETEAYDRHDPASHTYRGPTPRNAAMFGLPGHAYVYRSYGMHWCLNLVCGEEPGAAVLIRALQPSHGLATMQARRGDIAERLACAGPGRLCQALGITAALDGLPLDQPPFRLVPRMAPCAIVAGSRIGITQARETPWRFGLKGSRYLSRPFPGGR
jgi:DNA-3-methyladenine glycosylase